MLKINSIPFELGDWNTDADFRKIHSAEKKLKSIGNKAGVGSDKFVSACRRILHSAMSRSSYKIEESIVSTMDVRAFTYLLNNSKEFIARVKIDRELLDHLSSIRSPLSRLTLIQLIRSFFFHFDTIAKQKQLQDWSDFIKFELSRFDQSKGTSDLKNYAVNANLIFSPYGPARIIEKATADGIDFDGIVKKLSLNGFSDGRFLTLCRYQYYLKTLAKIPVGENNTILTEVCKRSVFNAPYQQDKQLGHAIIEILIDRSEGTQISQEWQNAILTIAGDPRVPKSHSNYQQWWALLGEKRISLMRGWLSRFDLKLFLKILEQSAKDSHNEAMKRMFTPRKVFMEGLESQGLVVESRLFLSSYAERYLYRHYRKDELPNFARVSSSETSMIYLNIAGKVHMVEGSHSFTLKLLDKLPSKSQINDYSLKEVKDVALRTYIGMNYRREFENDSGLAELRHDQHLNWQNKAVVFLKRHSVKVNISGLLLQSDYRIYKRKFGVHTW